MDGYWDGAQNIRITIGPSKSYDPNEPLCLPEISDLTRTQGLQDYLCTGNLQSGKFVKISRVGRVVLCEVKVFTFPEEPGKSSTSKQTFSPNMLWG